MDSLEVTTIKSAEALEALNRSEVDIQIATAKKYPRDVERARNSIEVLACIDEATAEDCFYTLRRNGGGNEKSVIEGPSVRLAEIVASCWGNLRVQSNIIGNDGRFITARGVCHDLETNFAVSCEVKRRITDKNGRTFSEDMQVVTGNAAGAIAFRNAVFKVVPPSVMKPIFEKIKVRGMGKSNEVETKRQNMLKYFASIGVSEEMILSYIEKEKIDDIDNELLFQLRGAANAIKEGTSTAKELFIDPFNKKKGERKTAGQKTEAQSMVEKAMKKQQGDEDLMFEESNNDDLPA